MEMAVERIEPERLFSYRWHPAASIRRRTTRAEPMTLVEFIARGRAPAARGSRSSSRASIKIPLARRAEAFRMNEGGWTEQMQNIERYVTQS